MVGTQSIPGAVSVEWSGLSRELVAPIANNSRFGGNVVEWHERTVQEHARDHVPEATRAQIL